MTIQDIEQKMKELNDTFQRHCKELEGNIFLSAEEKKRVLKEFTSFKTTEEQYLNELKNQIVAFTRLKNIMVN